MSATVLDFFVYSIDFIYAMLVMTIIFLSLHFKNKQKEFKSKIYAISSIFGILMLIISAVLTVDIIRGLVDNSTCKSCPI